MRKYFNLFRVNNWIKNIIVIFPIIFSLKLTEIDAVFSIFLAAISFCLASSIVYIINDIIDRERDKFHPRKKNRPIASGNVKVKTALIILSLLALMLLSLILFINTHVVLVIISYLVLNMLYVFVMKNMFLIDTFVIAINFVLRVLAGCYAIYVTPSHWILVVTFFVALFMGFIKRKSELIILKDRAEQHRKSLSGYTVKLLDKYIFITATVTIAAYLLYTIDPVVLKTFESNNIVYSAIFVVIGLFRFIQLSDSDKYESEADPTYLILRDNFIKTTILLWLVYLIVEIYLL
ncbi:MAG: decaprenyl-phosphate phosphoribosyltransferase [bacterium]